MDKKITLAEAALAAERSYRRGFQHGVNAAHKSGVTDEDAMKYRFETDYERDYGAPERFSERQIHIGHPLFKNLTDRFLCENRHLDR
jgi:hypothetical protein